MFIESIIKCDLKYPYAEEDQTKDKKYVIELLLHMYKYNYIDRCKLDSLLNNPPTTRKLGILLTSEKLEGAAEYFSISHLVFIPILVHLHDPVVEAQYLSHELRHAIDSYNNMRKGICIEKWAGLEYATAVISGFNKGDTCAFDTRDRNRVTKLIKKDLARIEEMYLSLLNSSASKHVELAGLLELIKKYNYKKTINASPVGGSSKQENIRNFEKIYQLDKARNSYVAGNRLLGSETSIEPLTKKYSFTEYYLRYNFLSNQAIKTYTSPNKETLLDLAEDLLINLLYSAHLAKHSPAYDEKSYPYEAGAFFDCALAPYSHKLAGSEKTLKEWLFPELSAHQLMRAADEVKECFAGVHYQ
jgi:hypothetical protein